MAEHASAVYTPSFFDELARGTNESARIVVPVANVAGSVYFVIAGTWLFHEHLPTSPAKLGLRLAAIVTAGLVLVTLSRQPSDPVAEEAGPEPSAVPGYVGRQ